jgi:2-phosphosulfolactate phosphatase
VHVILTNKFDQEDVAGISIKESVCAVIDTIRATSTIATMLREGSAAVIIAENKKDALRLKKIFNSYILCGEENGLPPHGFDYGNSPIEISGITAKDKNFILMTTNGTRSILKVREAVKTYTVSILNLYYAINSVINSALEHQSDILLLCSGEKGKIAYDDAFTAGLAVKYILSKPYKFEFSDSAKLVLSAALSEFDIIDALEKSCSAHSLRSVGLGNDIAFCAQKNKYQVAPVLRNASITHKHGNANIKILKKANPGHKDNLFIITAGQDLI